MTKVGKAHLATAGLTAATLAAALAVAAPDEKEASDDRLMVRKEIVAVGAGEVPRFVDHALTFVWAMEGAERRVVKGAPYAAEAVTETVQTLADGNRIVRRTSAEVSRDSEGRTRREHALGAVGPMLAAGDAPRTVFIDDPVAGVHYVLEMDQKVARRLKRPRGSVPEKPGDPVEQDVVAFRAAPLVKPGAAPELEEDVFIAPAPPPAAGPHHGPALALGGIGAKKLTRAPKLREEQLGKQVIEGVEAEGTQSSFTIPAGEIGNERPIEVVSERWYSPELQVVVLSRHKDPRFGETTYRLSNLTRGEPDRAQFEVPADFTVKAGPEPRIMEMRKKRPEKK